MGVTLASSSQSSDRIYGVVRRILEANLLCSIATTSEDGAPHINNAYYAYDDNLNLYFLSHPDSTHARNICRSGKAAVAVCDGRQPWGQTQAGLQLEGRGKPAAGDAQDCARRRYGGRFLLYTEFVEKRLTEAGLKPAFFELQFYVFRPASVKILAETDFGDEVYVTARVNAS